MRNISQSKKRFEKFFAKKYCGAEDTEHCPKKNGCSCKILAEIRAYLTEIIPENYIDYSINDFDGTVKGAERIIDAHVAKKAKEQIIKYCWDVELKDILVPGGSPIGFKNKFSLSQLNQKSLMETRKNEGRNVIIYSENNVEEQLQQALPKKRGGKTLAASLIFKEAIKRRAFASNISWTYEWIQANRLERLLIDERDDRDGGEGAGSFRSCDWLVIDDIMPSFQVSSKFENFVSTLWDSFLQERIDSESPTILIFDFDPDFFISSVENRFGKAMAKIVKDQFTWRIIL